MVVKSGKTDVVKGYKAKRDIMSMDSSLPGPPEMPDMPTRISIQGFTELSKRMIGTARRSNDSRLNISD